MRTTLNSTSTIELFAREHEHEGHTPGCKRKMITVVSITIHPAATAPNRHRLPKLIQDNYFGSLLHLVPWQVLQVAVGRLWRMLVGCSVSLNRSLTAPSKFADRSHNHLLQSTRRTLTTIVSCNTTDLLISILCRSINCKILSSCYEFNGR